MRSAHSSTALRRRSVTLSISPALATRGSHRTEVASLSRDLRVARRRDMWRRTWPALVTAIVMITVLLGLVLVLTR